MRILLTATVQSHIVQFHRPLVDMLHASGCEVHVAAKDNLAEKNGLLLDFADRVYNVPFSRSPMSLDNIRAYRELKEIICSNEYDVIHCNTPVGGVLTRMIARKERERGTKVIYTAHGFHFYTGAPLKNWLLYYPVEWLCAHWTDVLITINKEDYERAKKHMHAKRVEYVPGVGIDTKRFMNATVDRAAKRHEIGVPEDATLLMSVGELNENKNHSVVIKALAKLNDKSVHYAIAGNGPLKASLEVLAESLGVGAQLHLLGYRRDVPELYKAADICVFPSIREGQGLAALEGMAAGLPIIASDNRGTRDILMDNVNALICRCDDVEGFSDAIQTMASNNALRERLGVESRFMVQDYDLKEIQPNIYALYSDACSQFVHVEREREREKRAGLAEIVERQRVRREIGVPIGATLLASVGELSTRKNHEVVIKAMVKIADDNIHYIIVGNGPLNDRLTSIAQTLGLEQRVHLLGYRRDIPDLYKAADICLFPSKQEGLPVAVMEAMACGLPIIASRIRGVTDILLGSENLLVNNCNDENAFADAINWMLNEKALRAKLHENNPRTSKQFDIPSITKQMKEIYGLEH